MNLKHVALGLGVVAAGAGSAILAVWLLSLDDHVRRQGTQWLGIVLGPALALLTFLMTSLMVAMIADAFRGRDN